MNCSNMRFELVRRGEGRRASLEALPFSMMRLALVVNPLPPSFIESVWSKAIFGSANVWVQVSEDVPPKT
jgi:hypothetical protein